MEDVVLAGDVDVGDVITLPDADEPVLPLARVRLGKGGLIFTVAPASGDSAEQERPVSDGAGPAAPARPGPGESACRPFGPDVCLEAA